MHSISIFVVFALVLSSILAADVRLDKQWISWKLSNNKHYSKGQEIVRRAIWESNLNKVQEHNAKADQGLYTYWLGMNEYADLTGKEFAQVLNGYDIKLRKESGQDRPTFAPTSNVDIPDTVDWRKKGCVTAIKDQGQCGSCWAFSATGSIESQYCIKTGTLVSLSEQQLIDCSSKYGNMGCNGGLMEYAFQYLKDAGGSMSEGSYPYQAGGWPCKFNASGIIVKVCGFIDLPHNDETALKQAVATIGPMSVAIDASHSSFQLYRSGVYNEPACSATQLDHAVLIVGYGTDSGDDYWLVKNSWGSSWGEQGYIQMSRNKNNQCGIASMGIYPIIC